MIRYLTSVDGITVDQLRGGFFEGWLNPPAPEVHLRILQNSAFVMLALDDDAVVGFVNAISDHVLAAYIPLLEVLPNYRRQGIGGELMKRILTELRHLYVIDLMCDPQLQPFYEQFGMNRYSGMIMRNFDRQAGA
ncbi:MAG: GNAT family N-acetyltransferase [Anaerolineae bacterium]|nr:GNAT family N-acetyltransferase [Anaerolineae bacterium]MCA9910144.1 GNAT family N-acetyltransferase [Anaerolineae bacterium]